MIEVTAAELEHQAKVHAISKWQIHNCGGCGYPCGFVFHERAVSYDSGCWCASYGPSDPSPRSWDDVARQFNMQTSDAAIDKYREFWHLPPRELSR